MPTTAEYLNDLKNQQIIIAENLTSCGAAASSNELLDTLVPKVLDLAPISVTGEYTPSADTYLFSLENLPFRSYSIQIINYSAYGSDNSYLYFSYFDNLPHSVGGIAFGFKNKVATYNYLSGGQNPLIHIADNSFLLDPQGDGFIFKAGYTYKWILCKKQEV